MRTFVTGGSRGVGRAVVKACRGLGWEVNAPNRKVLDMEDEGSVEVYLGEHAAPELAIFCHGSWSSAPTEQQAVSDWMSQYMSRVVLPAVMINHWLPSKELRAVTLVASTRGFMGGVDTGPYSQACAAQIAMIVGYSREVEGCQFNVICPGLTDTDMGKDVIASGGAAPDAVPQPVKVVVDAILDTVVEGHQGNVVRVVDGKASAAAWRWGD